MDKQEVKRQIEEEIEKWQTNRKQRNNQENQHEQYSYGVVLRIQNDL
jgi:hypothetical protein